MHRRITLQHALVAALAATGIAASPALARPVDRGNFTLAAMPGQPAALENAGSDDHDTWLVLGIGIAATSIVAGSAAGARVHARRAPA
jgi:hypothetical protein